MLIVASGQGVYSTLRGVALLIEAQGRARAAMDTALMRQMTVPRRTPLPGPNAQADIEALWGDDD